MDIFFIHTEDEKYHIYKQKSKQLVLWVVLAVLVAFIWGYFFNNNTPVALIPFVIILITYFLGIFPMEVRKNAARNGLGNEVIENGHVFFGNYELKIEKKGLRF